TGMSLERFTEFPGGDVPQLHVAGATGHGQCLAVRRKGRVIDKPSPRLAISLRASIRILERPQRFPGFSGPEDHRPVMAGTGHQSRRSGIPREVERTTEARMSMEEMDLPARGDLPDLQRMGHSL